MSSAFSIESNATVDSEDVLTPLLQEIISISKSTFVLDRDITTLEEETRRQDEKLELITDETKKSCSGADTVAALTEELSKTSVRAKEIATVGIQSQNDFLVKFRTLQSLFDATTEFMADLKKRSDDIKHLSEILEDMGNQLNILSINTSIEAARAGTAGKGFAVIAKEMRSLYVKVNNSATTVGAQINVIIDGISSSNSNLQEAKKTLDANRQNAEKTGTDLNELGNLNTELAAKITEIAQRSMQQIDMNHTIDRLAKEVEKGSSFIRSKAGVSREKAASVHESVDKTLISFSKCRFPWHQKAEECMHALVARLAEESGYAVLQQSFKDCSWFELYYVMDESGIQVSENICNPAISFSQDFSHARGASRKTKDYFMQAIEKPNTCIFSDIYISSATDSLCVTVSLSYRQAERTFVLAGDINLDGILAIMK